jgi:HSP20 family protein
MEEIDAMLRDLAPSWHSTGCLEPLIHVREGDEEIIISADLPCVKKKDIELFCTEDAIEIRAKMARHLRFERWGTVQREITFKSFRRSIALPVQVIPEKAKASFRGGILEIRLPKKIRKRRIEVG